MIERCFRYKNSHLYRSLEALRFLNISVPGAVQVGEPVWLKCDFDLEGDDLYSVKWYKNHVEFYRYQPRDTPPGQTYRLAGTSVDTSNRLYEVYKPILNSRHTFILLQQGQQQSEINYTRFPSFNNKEGVFDARALKRFDNHGGVHIDTIDAKIWWCPCTKIPGGPDLSLSTWLKEGNSFSLIVSLLFPALPSNGPDIIGLQPRYQVGDEVNITCSFGPSKPAAKVNWYINGEVAQTHQVTHLPPRKTTEGLQWIEMRLIFNMAGKYIRKGGLRLQCLAEVFLTYARSQNELVIGERLSGPGPQNAPNVIPSRRRPRVSGSSSRYDVGDLVDINCTSAKETTPPILRWFINDREVPRLHLVDYGSIRSQSSSLVSSVLGLRFHVQQHHLRQGELRLRCESTLAREILRRREEVIFEGRLETAELQVAQIANSVAANSAMLASSVTTLLLLLLTLHPVHQMFSNT
ncbi:hypothetical protein JTE90_011565 [Oedothorax gibbosus]|uniref:Ig-like domain-containing protein n=1 Tax=Oedothorax gibbosus TaxID=931172 RepID=A0AAV6UM35_9ARAC|nr:hypothetical protein JTE90_011565 [Oedothorax gibbosus]